MSGFVSLVGAGPGDPSLVTLAAVRAIREADIVLYDALVHPAILQHASSKAQLIFVGKRGGHEGTTQAQIHQLLLQFAHEGKNVCRLKGGDPLLFGRGSEEAEVLHAAGVRFEIVPGVSSFIGATAYAGIALTHRELASSVALVTSSEHAEKIDSAHDWSKLATATQTIVLFMGARKLRAELARIVKFGRPSSTPAAAIEWGTFARQRVIEGTLETLADLCEDAALGPPALIVIGSVVSLRPVLQWWDQSVLSRKCIAILRPIQQGESLTERLRRAGAEVLHVPAITIQELSDVSALESALRAIATYDFLLFSSAHGVRHFAQHLTRKQLDWRAILQTKVIAIGPATATALAQTGLIADVVASSHRSDGLADAVVRYCQDHGKSVEQARVCFVRALHGRDEAVTLLRANHMAVDVVPVYETVQTPQALEPIVTTLKNGALDVVLLTSPSIVHALRAALGPEAAQMLAPVTVCAIGETTHSACEISGIRVDVIASEPTDDGIVSALETHFRRP